MAKLTLEEAARLAGKLREGVAKSVFGQEALITETLCCLLAGGHILMTGAPGLAKTTLVRVFAHHLGLTFGRVQFTPDLLPADIIGSEILNVEKDSGRRHFEFAPGPVFTNLLLADEINRASPRTQSALLEAMQERAVTAFGKRHQLPLPFMVFATQNPFESEGTFPLPEAQLDRFLVHTLVDYPDDGAEMRILKEHALGQLVGEQQGGGATAGISGTSDHLTVVEVESLLATTRAVPIDEAILSGIKDLVRSTRPDDPLCPETLRPSIWYGAGPRAGISLVSTSRALALLERSDAVRWSHVRRLVKPVLRHRLRLSAQGTQGGLTEDRFLDQLLERLESRQKNLAKGIA